MNLPINPDTQLDQLVSQIFETLTSQFREATLPSPMPTLQSILPTTLPQSMTSSTMNVMGLPPSIDSATLAKLIDHTLLKASATRIEVEALCLEAKTYGFATVCINGSYVEMAKKFLAGSNVAVCAVIGFPLGAMTTAAKVHETQEVVQLGADEVDMVIHQGALKIKDYVYVMNDIQQVVRAAGSAKVKVILEMGALTPEEKVVGIVLSKLAGAHFVKTSTGFGAGGATVEDISLMRRLVGTSMGVKASGAIRTRQDAERMIQAGANRLGTSSSVAIIGSIDSSVVKMNPGY